MVKYNYNVGKLGEIMQSLKKLLILILDRIVVCARRCRMALMRFAARCLPLQNVILLESVPPLTDNTFFVYEELLRRGYNKKYRMYWTTHTQPPDTALPENVFFLRVNPSEFREQLRVNRIIARAKCIIDCNDYVYKLNRRTKRIHLKHGLALKDVPEYNHLIGETDVVCVTADYWVQKTADDHRCDPSVVKPLGFARNDILLHPTPHAQKAIIWMPTYRVHKHQSAEMLAQYQKEQPFGVPCIRTEADLADLNAVLAAHDALLYIRLHPAQKGSLGDLHAYSNLRVCDNAFLEARGTPLYAFLTETDALISDFSSIYYDYLLLDKPIALAIQDFDTYRKNTGLIVDTEEEFREAFPAVFLKTYADLRAFVEQTLRGEDAAREARTAAREKYMGAQTDHAASDIADYLEKQYRL